MKPRAAPRVAHCLLVLILAAAAISRADQVTLDNGDRLTGTVKRIGGGKVVISTEYAGDVSVDLKRITSLQTDADMTVVLDDDTRLYGRVSGDAKNLEISGRDQPVETARVSTAEPGRVTGEEWKFGGRIALGGSNTSGNAQTRTLYWDAEEVARQAKNRYTLGGRGNYTTSGDEQTQNNTVIYAQYDRFFSPKWYGYANASAENNEFADIKLRGVAGVGGGFQWLDTPRTKLALEGGLSYVSTDYYSTDSQQYPAARLVTKFDYWLWTSKAQFFNYNEFYSSLNDFDNSFLRTQIGFRLPLIDNFLAIVQWNLDWNGNPPPGKVEWDRTLIFSVGYLW